MIALGMFKRMIFALSFLGLSVAPVSADRAAEIYCVVNTSEPRPCVTRFTTDARGVRTVRMTVGKSQYVFIGRARDGWWSGRLNGKPAMGYELNRANVKFSTSDLSLSVQYYYSGSQNGTY
jgi:hypothetical protein